MQTETIVGVRYVGKKPQPKDTVCKTGAVWSNGQVLNFSSSLAKQLFVHTDSFAEAPVAMDAATFMSRGKTVRAKNDEVAAVVNLTGMGIEQMALFARVEFGRTINVDGKDEAQVRREIHALMTCQTLDDEEKRRKSEMAADGREAFTYMATAEEAEALRAGVVVLGVIPAEVANFTAPADIKPAEPTGDEIAGKENPSESNPNAGGSGAGDTGGEGGEPPKLQDLLSSLDKKGLAAFAKQEGVKFSNAMTEEKLREKIFAELSARSEKA